MPLAGKGAGVGHENDTSAVIKRDQPVLYGLAISLEGRYGFKTYKSFLVAWIG